MFSIFDIIVLTTILISSIMGLYRGMIYITINLLGFVASVFTAMFLYSYVRAIFSQYIANALVTSIGSGIVSYILSLIVFTALSAKVVSLFKDLSKGLLDRMIGFAIGIASGGLISLLIFSAIAVFTAGTYTGAEKPEDVVHNLQMDKYPEWLKDSVVTPYLEKALKKIINYIPQELLDSIILLKEDKETNRIDKIKRKKQGEIKSTIDGVIEKDSDENIPDSENKVDE